MEKDNVYYPNYDDFEDAFHERNFKISLTAQGIQFIVNADNEGDALDYVIDYCEENLPGLIMTYEEEAEEEYLDEYICGGNHGHYLSTRNVFIGEM